MEDLKNYINESILTIQDEIERYGEEQMKDILQVMLLLKKQTERDADDIDVLLLRCFVTIRTIVVREYEGTGVDFSTNKVANVFYRKMPYYKDLDVLHSPLKSVLSQLGYGR